MLATCFKPLDQRNVSQPMACVIVLVSMAQHVNVLDVTETLVAITCVVIRLPLACSFQCVIFCYNFL